MKTKKGKYRNINLSIPLQDLIFMERDKDIGQLGLCINEMILIKAAGHGTRLALRLLCVLTAAIVSDQLHQVVFM